MLVVVLLPRIVAEPGRAGDRRPTRRRRHPAPRPPRATTTRDQTEPTAIEPTTTEPTTTPSEPTTTASTSTAAAATDGPLVGIGEVELVADGFQFTEGPQWMDDEGVLLFTDAAGTIFQVGTDDEISDFRRPSDGANGLAVDTEGRLLAAESSTRRVTRTESDGTVTPIAEQFEGSPLNQPNDIAVRSDGTIYFTDPYYGDGTTELDFHGVFRIAPDGSLTAERRGAITEQPNGVALSPDETPALRLQPGGRPGMGLRRR